MPFQRKSDSKAENKEREEREHSPMHINYGVRSTWDFVHISGIGKMSKYGGTFLGIL